MAVPSLSDVRLTLTHGHIRKRGLPKFHSFTKTLRSDFMLFTSLGTPPRQAPPGALLGRNPPTDRWRRWQKRPIKQFRLFLSSFSIQVSALEMGRKSVWVNRTIWDHWSAFWIVYKEEKKMCWLWINGKMVTWLNCNQLRGFFCLLFSLKFFFKSVLCNCPQRLQKAQLKCLLSFAATASPPTLASQSRVL